MKQEPFELLFNAVNEQGYLFQDSCEQKLRTTQTEWEVRASEYPVSGDEETRIDIVLQTKSSTQPVLYAIVECKRADPDYVYWLFGARRQCSEEALCSTLGFDRETSSRGTKRLVMPLQFRISTYQTKWWLEAKSKNTNGSTKRVSTPQNIESAFQQVLKGVGLFAVEQLEQWGKGVVPFKSFFIPVVITTAPLYIAHYKPEDIDLGTGKVDKNKIKFGTQNQQSVEEVGWVLVDYGIGKDLGWGSIIPNDSHDVDPALLQKYKMRSIFVVNSKHIQPFFSNLSLVVKS